MGVFGQASNPLRGAPEERLGQENGLLGAGPQGTGSALLSKKKDFPNPKSPSPPPQKKNFQNRCDTGGAHLPYRWAHRHLLISNQGGAIGMLDQYTGYSNEMLEQMNSVSLIGGELLPFPY